MCGNANPNMACGVIMDKFKPKIINVVTHFRGKLDE
jgi:S-adenosylmethionine/arginine decarboxylase-like enzyme